MRLVALIAFLSLFSAGAAADEKLTVVTDLWPPYVTQDGSKIGGPSTKIVRQVLNRSNIPYEIQLVPWARAYETALTKENVLIYNLVRTEDRENRFKWVGEMHANDPTHIFGIGIYKQVPADLNDAKKHMIAAVRNSMSAEALQNHGFKVGVNMVLTEDDTSAIRLAEMGRTDFVATSQKTIEAYIGRFPFLDGSLEKGPNLLDSRLFLAASKMTDNKIINKLKTAFKAISEESPTN